MSRSYPEKQKKQPAAEHRRETPAQPASAQATTPMLTNETKRYIFFGSLIAMLLIVLFAGFNVGFNSDEIELNLYGKANMDWYASGGKDTTLRGEHFKYLNTYGNGFEMIAVGANRILGTGKGPHEFNVRHFLNEIIAIIGLLYAGLTARKFTRSWDGAIFTIWLLYLTPSFFGHFYFNTRDIPFFAGYIAAIYYIIVFLEGLPNPRWTTSAWLAIAYAFTTNVRIGGLLIVPYLFMFMGLYLLLHKDILREATKKIVPLAGKLGLIVVGGTLLVVVTWPVVFQSPKFLFQALEVASKFPLKVNINFEGNAINSLEVPYHYIPKYMLVTIPLLIVACIITGTVLYFTEIRKYNLTVGMLILFSTIFPVVYAVSSHAALYSSWRHFLFIYPGLCILGSLALIKLFSITNKPAIKSAIAAVCILALLNPVFFCIRNNPYAYCYFNELAGGFKKAYYTYDNDYWEISVKDGVDWLMQHENLADTKDTVVIASNAQLFVSYYLEHHYPKAKLKVVASGTTLRNSNYWQYAIFNTVFLKPDYLENYFPPPFIYAKNIDEMPVTIVLKDTARLDWKASLALKNGEHKKADSLFKEYIRTTKDDNVGLYAYMSVSKGSLTQNDEAIVLGKKALEYHLSPLVDYNAYCGLGIAYANKRNWGESIGNLNKALALLPAEPAAKDILRQVYAAKKALGN